MIEKDIIDKIIGFDVHVLTQNNEKKTLSFLDFVNEQNSEITISKDDNKKPYYKLDLHIGCDGYGSKIQYFDGWIPVEDHLPNEDSNITIHCFVEMKHRESTSSFRTRIDWSDGYWIWSNGKRLSDKYEVLAWQKIQYPNPYKKE